jgi:DNA transformation protein
LHQKARWQNELPRVAILLLKQQIIHPMNTLAELPNIGVVLSKKLNQIGVKNERDLKQMGSEEAILKISALQNSGACINMLYALEGAIQGIRWHNLSQARKKELTEYYHMLTKQNQR